MTEEVVKQKPYITIDGVQISVDDLPEKAKPIFGRLVRVINKEINASLDLEEYRASKLHYENLIKAIYNESKEPTPANGEDEPTAESNDSE
jgi:hypothetical protein